MTTKEGKPPRGGTPIVCLAHRLAFQQEADSLAALAAPDRPVPRIDVRIVPDAPAEKPQRTEDASGGKDAGRAAESGAHGAPRPEAGLAGGAPGGSSPVEVLLAGADRGEPASGFGALVRPLAVQEFLDTRYRDKRPVLFRAQGPRFASLCTWDALDALLSSGIWQGRMHLFRDDKPIPERYYTTPHFGLGWRARREAATAERHIDDRRLKPFLRKGATIVMSAFQEIHPPLRPLLDAVEEALGGYAGVNLYASWAATRGFATHWDGHDVFVLQVAGRKRWQVYGETRRFPLTRDSEPTVKPPRKAVWSEVLEAGDALYLPRGWWHDARAEPGDGADGAGSLHLTCSVLPATGLDLMEWLSGRLARHEAFRRDLPHPADEAGAAHYAALRELVIEELQGDLGRKLHDHMRSTWSEPSHVSLGPTIEPWKSPDWERYGLRLRGASHATVERTADGDAVLEANGYRWTFDGRCVDLMTPLLRGEVVCVGALRDSVPEGDSTAFADELARLLVMQGVAEAVPPAPVAGA